MRRARLWLTEDMEIDLWNTKDSDLLGRVGEAVGWKYLWRQGFTTWDFWRVVQTDLFRECMTVEQENYLNEFGSGKRPGRAWDLAGVDRRSRRPCLVEVKTTRGERYKTDRRKLVDEPDRREVKRIGFRVLLVVVRLTDNWKFLVHGEQL